MLTRLLRPSSPSPMPWLSATVLLNVLPRKLCRPTADKIRVISSAMSEFAGRFPWCGGRGGARRCAKTTRARECRNTCDKRTSGVLRLARERSETLWKNRLTTFWFTVRNLTEPWSKKGIAPGKKFYRPSAPKCRWHAVFEVPETYSA